MTQHADTHDVPRPRRHIRLRKHITIDRLMQISYVGYEHVDHDTVSDAIAGQTLFIHGSRVDDGSGASIKATAAAAKRNSNKKEEDKTSIRDDQATTTMATKRRWRRRLSADQKSQRRKMRSSECPSACGSKETRKALPRGTSTVCDATCGGGDDARFDGFLCGAGDSEKFGGLCRLCYTRVDDALEAQRALLSSHGAGGGGGAAAGASDSRDVIMCDTMQPPVAAEEEEGAVAAVGTVDTNLAACSDKCIEKEDTVSVAVQNTFFGSDGGVNA